MRISVSAVLLAGGLVPIGEVAWAQSDLDQRLRVIERKLELQSEEASSKATTATSASAGEKGFSLKSAMGGYELKIRALAQIDGRFFLTEDRNPPQASGTVQANDAFLIRRLRPTFEGTAGPWVGFRLTPEFAGDGAGQAASIVDAYIDLNFSPAARLRVGKQKGPVGIERLQSGSAISFVERGLTTELVPNRDIGAALHGSGFSETVSYTLGVFNGTADGRDVAGTDADSRETEARLFVEPFRRSPGVLQGLGFGVGGSYGTKRSAVVTTTSTTQTTALAAANGAAANAVLPRYRTSAQNQFFSYRVNSTGINGGGLPQAPSAADTVTADGEHLRYAPQLYWYYGRFGLLGEYVSSEQDVAIAGSSQTFQHRAYQAVASVVLTGEDASYRGVTRPTAPWTVGASGWGALEFVARHGELDVDDGVFPLFANPASSASRARSYGAGFNWILTPNAKVALDFDETRFLGGAAGGGDRPREQSVFTRLQLTY